jgi:hypothetical protein
MNVARLVTSRVNALCTRLSSQSSRSARQILFNNAGVPFRSVVGNAAKTESCDKEEFLTMMTEPSGTGNNVKETELKENEGLVINKESVAANLLVMQFLASKAPVAGARFHDS